MSSVADLIEFVQMETGLESGSFKLTAWGKKMEPYRRVQEFADGGILKVRRIPLMRGGGKVKKQQLKGTAPAGAGARRKAKQQDDDDDRSPEDHTAPNELLPNGLQSHPEAIQECQEPPSPISEFSC